MRGFGTSLAVALTGLLLLCVSGGCSVLSGRLSDKHGPAETVEEWMALPRSDVSWGE